jgi:flavin-dependent dehydrogenase
MPGGFYIAPMAAGLSNVNVVVRKDKVRKDDMKLQTVMDGFIHEHPELSERFQNAERVGRIQGAPLALATARKEMVSDGVLYAGDAAGLIDLISANGIPQALLSGRMSAEWAQRAIQNESYSTGFLKGYERDVQKAIREDVRMGRLLGPFLGYPLLCRWTLKGMSSMMSDDGTGGLLQELLYSDQPLKTLAGHLNPLS